VIGLELVVNVAEDGEGTGWWMKVYLRSEGRELRPSSVRSSG
jgi:hypothetical protein